MVFPFYNNLIKPWISKTRRSPDSILETLGLHSITSDRGFLPSQNPLHFIPGDDDLTVAINKLAHDIPQLLKAKRLRKEIDLLNNKNSNARLLFDEDNYAHKSIVLSTLLMLCQGYIWEENDKPANRIPAVLAKNIYSICKRDQRFPTLTYTDYILNNWKLRNSHSGIALDNVEPLFTFTGSKDEAWFINIHVTIEANSGKALHAAFQAYIAANQMYSDKTKYHNQVNQEKLETMMNQISESVQNAASILKRLKDNCDPDFYWTVMRNYLIGWSNIKVKLPDGKEEIGIKFEGVASKDKTLGYIYTGASGTQSSIMPSIDAILGVEHEIDSMYLTLLTQEQYMPIEHQLFINLMKLSKLKHIVLVSDSHKLKKAWKNALESLKSFRNEHLNLVEDFIYKPAAKQGIAEESTMGTGGSPIKSYLGSRYQSTEDTENSVDDTD